MQGLTLYRSVHHQHTGAKRGVWEKGGEMNKENGLSRKRREGSCGKLEPWESPKLKG